MCNTWHLYCSKPLIKIQLMNVTNATFACKFQKLPYQMDHKQIWLCLPVLYMHQYFARQLLPVQISATRKLMYIFNINITWLLTNNSVYSIVPKQVCMHKNVHIKFDSEFAHQNINHSKMLSPQHRESHWWKHLSWSEFNDASQPLLKGLRSVYRGRTLLVYGRNCGVGWSLWVMLNNVHNTHNVHNGIKPSRMKTVKDTNNADESKQLHMLIKRCRKE